MDRLGVSIESSPREPKGAAEDMLMLAASAAMRKVLRIVSEDESFERIKGD